MSDFISLTCPNCGAQLRREAGAASARCNYCGTEHLLTNHLPPPAQKAEFVRKKAWQTEAVEHKENWRTLEKQEIKCPSCHSSGEVVLIQPYLFAATESGQNAIDKKISFPQFDCDIPLLPVRDELPMFKKPDNIFLVAVLIVIVWIFGFTFLYSVFNSDGIFAFCSSIFFCGFMFWLGFKLLKSPVAFNVKREVEARRQLENSLEQQYQEEMLAYRARQLEFEKRQKQYQEKLSLWKELYFCQRDQSVFFSAETGQAPASEMLAFIGQEWKRRQGQRQ